MARFGGGGGTIRIPNWTHVALAKDMYDQAKWHNHLFPNKLYKVLEIKPQGTDNFILLLDGLPKESQWYGQGWFDRFSSPIEVAQWRMENESQT